MGKDREMNDLDILFPDVYKTKKFTAADGKTYEYNLFIPAAVTLLASQKDDESDKSGTKKQIKVLEAFFKKQHPHMDAEWIEENIPMQYQNAIYMTIVKELAKSNKLLGEE